MEGKTKQSFARIYKQQSDMLQKTKAESKVLMDYRVVINYAVPNDGETKEKEMMKKE